MKKNRLSQIPQLGAQDRDAKGRGQFDAKFGEHTHCGMVEKFCTSPPKADESNPAIQLGNLGLWKLGSAMALFLPVVVLILAGCDRKGKAVSDILKTEGKTRAQALGREVYTQYCVHCHGTEGRADGLNAYNLKVKPLDFSTLEFQRSRSDAEIEKFVEIGGHKSGKSALCPEWGKTLPARKIVHLRHYLRTLVIRDDTKQ